MFIKETWLNATENYICGDSGIYEAFTDKVGELFKRLQKEYGRCAGPVYIDKSDGKASKIGWIFQKREKYTDCNKYYLKETWVELHSKKPITKIENHFKELE